MSWETRPRRRISPEPTGQGEMQSTKSPPGPRITSGAPSGAVSAALERPPLRCRTGGKAGVPLMIDRMAARKVMRFSGGQVGSTPQAWLLGGCSVIVLGPRAAPLVVREMLYQINTDHMGLRPFRGLGPDRSMPNVAPGALGYCFPRGNPPEPCQNACLSSPARNAFGALLEP